MENSPQKHQSEFILILLLAAIQFTHILDFVIMMPLGPQLMRIFSIDTSQFGLLVSSYTFSAGFFGLLGMFYLDRFDRKKAMIVLYFGFNIGTLFCALSPTYEFLMSSRILTGAFGGILGALIFSIIGDLFPYHRRGAATGAVMSAFSVASVVGVPLGLYLADLFNWHIPFFSLGGLGTIILILFIIFFPNMNKHRENRITVGHIELLKTIISNKNHQKAFLFMSLMMFAGFSVIPFISPYLVFEAGLLESQLPYLYLIGGSFTFFTSPWFGKLADKYGKNKIFTINAYISILPILLITTLPQSPVWLILTVTTLFFIAVNGRMVPAIAMITSSVIPANRGSFMSMNSAVQQISSGLASFFGGLLIGSTTGGEGLSSFWIIGVFAIVATLLCIMLSKKMVVAEGN